MTPNCVPVAFSVKFLSSYMEQVSQILNCENCELVFLLHKVLYHKMAAIEKLQIFPNKKIYLNLNSKITAWPLSATSSVQL